MKHSLIRFHLTPFLNMQLLNALSGAYINGHTLSTTMGSLCGPSFGGLIN